MTRLSQLENLAALFAIIAGCWRLWDWPVAAIVGGGLLIFINLAQALLDRGFDA